MFERHANRQMYFNEQVFTTEKYVIPYIQQVYKINNNTKVLEIGCGECGNLKPFLDLGCEVWGVDYDIPRINLANEYLKDHPNKKSLHLIAKDIYTVNPAELPKFDLVIMRDTIEHIPNQALFLKKLYDYLQTDAIIFFGFPPWRMPFGGHQQLCKSPLLSKLPWFHILPNWIYFKILKWGGEPDSVINDLKEIKETRISIHRFKKIIKNNNYSFLLLDHYLFNPNYEIKFKIKPKKVWGIFKIPFIKDFYTMAIFAIAQKKV